MTDRAHSLTVVLSQDLRTDDVQGLVDAILHLKGVTDVARNVRSLESFVYEMRARAEIRDKIMEVIYPKATG